MLTQNIIDITVSGILIILFAKLILHNGRNFGFIFYQYSDRIGKEYGVQIEHEKYIDHTKELIILNMTIFRKEKSLINPDYIPMPREGYGMNDGSVLQSAN